MLREQILFLIYFRVSRHWLLPKCKIIMQIFCVGNFFFSFGYLEQ
jgi:Na+-transporting methylmalonyl-CoA/oxaloacetate decarboxylase beta subunit